MTVNPTGLRVLIVEDISLTDSLLLGAAMAGETGPSTGAVAKDVPLGHKDFVPTPEQPVYFRQTSGDYLGATPPLEWWEGTPVQVDMKVATGGFPLGPARVTKVTTFARNCLGIPITQSVPAISYCCCAGDGRSQLGLKRWI